MIATLAIPLTAMDTLAMVSLPSRFLAITFVIVIIVIIIIKLVVLLLLDFDECVNEMDNNCAQMCQNTNGSYSCECRDGYSLASNGYSCYGKSTLMSTIILFL